MRLACEPVLSHLDTNVYIHLPCPVLHLAQHAWSSNLLHIRCFYESQKLKSNLSAYRTGTNKGVKQREKAEVSQAARLPFQYSLQWAPSSVLPHFSRAQWLHAGPIQALVWRLLCVERGYPAVADVLY